MSTHTRLVLFDIDGTLMITRGAGSRCMLRACREMFGDDFTWGPITVGTLDPQIFADLCRHNRIADFAERHDVYRQRYCAILARELEEKRDDVLVMPGIRELLAALRQRDGVKLGILTGNYRQAVALKLAAAGFDMTQFDVILAAEDGEDRPALVREAMRRADVCDPARVAVIGDTPRDVACAQAHGCRSLAVATGRYSVEQLRQAGADLALVDLSAADADDVVLGLIA